MRYSVVSLSNLFGHLDAFGHSMMPHHVTCIILMAFQRHQLSGTGKVQPTSTQCSATGGRQGFGGRNVKKCEKAIHDE